MNDHSVIERVAQHCLRPVDDAARTRARLHLLDWLACVAGARQTAVAAVVAKAEPDIHLRAAFLGNVLEMDDIERCALLHPGPVVWPAALAAAQETGCSLDAMLDGAVRGYEAMIAIGTTFDARHYAHYHNTATAGGFGAAAAAASIYGCDTNALAWALGNAGSVAGGLWHMRHDDVMTKQFHAAHAALTGLRAARMAQHGFTGPRAILEGAQGLYSATMAAPKPLVLTDTWAMTRVSFKPWAACRHAHPVIDCALELRRTGQLQPPFRIETYRDAIVFCDRPNPVTETDAKFSLQHAVAVVADGRNADPADFTLAAIADLAPLRAQVSVSEAADITSRYPAHFGARMHSRTASVERIDTLGDPERPLNQAGLTAKARTLAAWGGLTDTNADRMIGLALEGNDPALISRMLEGWL